MQAALVIHKAFAEAAPDRCDHVHSAKNVPTHDVVRVQPAVTVLLQQFRHRRLSAAHASSDSDDALHHERATD
jgi:hypothetical protein